MDVIFPENVGKILNCLVDSFLPKDSALQIYLINVTNSYMSYWDIYDMMVTAFQSVLSKKIKIC